MRNIKAEVRNRTLFETSELQFRKGELVALIGRNGSGKSTLLKALAGLDSMVEGEIIVDEEIHVLKKNYYPSSTVSYIPVKIAPFGSINLLDFVLSGKSEQRNFMDIPRKEERETVIKLLEQFQMQNMVYDSFENLSDGEQKLALIMRSVYRNSEVLLLDEPESFLDVGNRKLVFEWLRKLSNQGKTIIFSTHQPDLASKYIDSFIYIQGGQLKRASKDELSEKTKIIFDSY